MPYAIFRRVDTRALKQNCPSEELFRLLLLGRGSVFWNVPQSPAMLLGLGLPASITNFKKHTKSCNTSRTTNWKKGSAHSSLVVLSRAGCETKTLEPFPTLEFWNLGTLKSERPENCIYIYIPSIRCCRTIGFEMSPDAPSACSLSFRRDKPQDPKWPKYI